MSLQIKARFQGQTHYRVRSTSFEPLMGFTNNCAQMSSMMSLCAVRKVIVQG